MRAYGSPAAHGSGTKIGNPTANGQKGNGAQLEKEYTKAHTTAKARIARKGKCAGKARAMKRKPAARPAPPNRAADRIAAQRKRGATLRKTLAAIEFRQRMPGMEGDKGMER